MLNSYHHVVVSPLRPPPPSITSTNFSPPSLLPNFRTTIPPTVSSPLLVLASKSTGFFLPSLKVSSLRSCFFRTSVIGNTTAPTNEAADEHMPLSTQPNQDEAITKHNDEDIEDRDVANEHLDDHKMVRICNKLIEVFMVDKPTPTDWKRLLTFSKEWDDIRPHFYKRCQDRADSETDPGMKHKLFRLARKLKEIDEDVQRHNELLDAIRKSPSEVGEIVARRRKDFTKDFFVHLHTVAESYYDNPTEQNAVAKLGNTCLAAVEAYDTATESIEALNAAELKFQDIINSPSVDAACRKIDNLAEKNELDSALVLMITKAWSAAKESNMMKDEVKDILYHLYKTSRGNLQRLMPKEIRIVKYLLTIEDPEERMSALKDAFTPGEEFEGKDVDCLYTTPEQLHTWIRSVVDAYHFSREGTLIREARDLMNPKIIQKLEELKRTVQDNFM
ncbi:hypothetical protein BUALT_Bualt05G0002900 [Buddleja alternifolia]|uniref:Uncharacterized protein n=1 Tax=Buddleja alternifolia TaxID=168488 RepID=A0AAV6XGT5_9LAMI|nr:hypothetical protein BUALT_Bualt05G0002900 [Buddleja alternifolia]